MYWVVQLERPYWLLVLEITLVVQIPALGVGRRLLGQHGEGSDQE
jgi:hypothetical protein